MWMEKRLQATVERIFYWFWMFDFALCYFLVLLSVHWMSFSNRKSQVDGFYNLLLKYMEGESLSLQIALNVIGISNKTLTKKKYFWFTEINFHTNFICEMIERRKLKIHFVFPSPPQRIRNLRSLIYSEVKWSRNKANQITHRISNWLFSWRVFANEIFPLPWTRQKKREKIHMWRLRRQNFLLIQYSRACMLEKPIICSNADKRLF